jgi:hypothetical protein
MFVCDYYKLATPVIGTRKATQMHTWIMRSDLADELRSHMS